MRAVVAVVAVLPLVLVPTAQAAPSGGIDTPCLRMGSPVSVLGHVTPACMQFYADTAVHAPLPTSTTAYGYLEGAMGAVHTFHSVYGSISVANGVGAKIINSVSLSGRLFVRATIAAGEVTAVEPWLYINESAVTSVYANKQITGRAVALAPPAGVPASMWMRIAFAKGVIDVSGRIVNYQSSVKAHGSCHPAMLSSSTASFVRQTLGSHGGFTVSWSPAMHAPGDSEVVLQTFRGPSYMTRGPVLSEIISGPWAPAEVSFVIHGNPVGTIAQLRGSVGPRTSVVPCS